MDARLASLVSEQCPCCDGWKRKGQSFCRHCYYSLPADMRQALYHRFGQGYEDALDAAAAWLRDHSLRDKALAARD